LIVERLPSGPLTRVWFNTAGCPEDKRGACTMCNYGAGGPTTGDEMVAQVEAAISGIAQPEGTLLVSPSGSLFDAREVPTAAALAILRLAAASGFGAILTETRPETLTASLVDQALEAVAGRAFGVELGLESSDQAVLNLCVNKIMRLADWRTALALLSSRGVPVTANVSLGTAFLSPAEAIDDAVATVLWALRHGSRDCAVFPLIVRDWTVLAHLWRRGRHEPPSLWSLVETLIRVGPDIARRVSISWYKDYDQERGGASADMTALAVPTTCPDCHAEVVRRLDSYRATGDFEVVAGLDAFTCPCHDSWRASLDGAQAPWTHRLPSAYEALGREVLGETWWAAHGSGVLDWLGVALGESGAQARGQPPVGPPSNASSRTAIRVNSPRSEW
jgi:radical SAM enzyme (TIGR01210 family)